ncbi:hypothetical protein KMC53_gp56 [Klebsiella phage LASTA]|uniref:Uncharacterized protein n=2 Tax=Lastavirus lasta TaxID=2845090 RepID=A0A6H0X3I5_9CAUD|nr:hypothetical protein KMC53_gp56 [Klebsiella phage LASTA]QIW86683.1 hypothetical protein 24149LASTA_00056 [Klebsiella phage LASTA]QIW86759.1 hypothetical protein 24147SJM3_00056 [Klebsiella phage SJM3]
MIRIFMAGQNVPEWLEKVTQTDPNKPYVRPKVIFNHPTVVYVKNSQYHIRSIIAPRVNVGVIKVHCGENFTLYGQSPGNSGKPVNINCSPIVNYFELFLLAIIAVGSVFIFK